MKSKQTVALNLELPEELGKRFNEYIARVVAHQGYVPFGIKSTIALWSIKEWLDKNDLNLDIDFARPTGNRKR